MAERAAAGEDGERYDRKTIYETFFKSGLHGATWPSDAYCVVKFVNSGTVRVFKKTSVHHAEIFMLGSAEFQGMLKGEINVYISYSCCGDCSTAIIRTIEAKKEVVMNIVAAGPFNVDRDNCQGHHHRRSDWNEGNADGLINIFQHPRMTLRAFKKNDWEKLVKLLKKSGDCGGEVTFDDEEYQTVQREVLGVQRSREQEDEFAANDFEHIELMNE